MPIELTERQRRLLDALLALAVVALGFVVMGFLGDLFFSFGDIVLLFFLAWLLSFALLPLINLVALLLPRLPHGIAVLLVYGGFVILVLALLVQISATLAGSIGQAIQDAPQLQVSLESLLSGIQTRLQGFGFNVDLVSQAPVIVANLQRYGVELVGPLQSLAVASIGVIGNLLILVMVSIYIALDRASILAFLYRLVPPSFATEARLLQVSVSRSFGGFLRGQLIMGVAYAFVAGIAVVLFKLDYGAATALASGVLHAIPFFGPFVSWVPPVAVAMLSKPDAALPTLVIMAIGWFVTMNILQPRLMADSVGIHPIVVLGSVVIGSKVAGIAGAIFGIPVAAVVSAFFFHFFARSRETGAVADRAAKRVAAREGRPVRRPREPEPGVDEDVDEVAPTAGTTPRVGLAEGGK
ncbi:MAG: AI-2E family transporter [Chloroflexota bacterium]